MCWFTKLCNTKGAEPILFIHTFHMDVLSVNSTHSNITRTLLLSLPLCKWKYFLAFFMPQEHWINEINFLFNFLFQLENSIHTEQAITEIELHKELHLLLLNQSVLTQPPLIPVGNSAAWISVDKQAISHPQMHGTGSKMWVICPPYHKYQNSTPWLSFLTSKTQESRM